MDGQDVFKQAVNKLSEATEMAYDCGLNISDIDWFHTKLTKESLKARQRNLV